MKSFRALGFAALLSVCVALPAAADRALSPALQVKQMGRGVNILSDDPIWRDPSKARFQPRHFKVIREGGFDTVRIVLQSFSIMNATYDLPKSWFATLDGLVKDALAQKLTVILDEHDFAVCGRDAGECRLKLMAFWRQVSTHYRKAPNKVVFEILNEPNRALDAAWNSIHAEALAIIRKTNPKRNVIIGPAFWNNVEWLDRLALPKKDKHLIVTVHYYLPMKFTHQGARWTPENKELGVTWGTPEDVATLERHFDGVQAWSKENGRPILLGEFGAYDKGPIESRVAYTSAVARAAEKRGWAWTYWQFDNDFTVYDIEKDQWNEPILEALIPRN